MTRKVIGAPDDQMIAEGYLVGRRGAGTIVNQAPRRRSHTGRQATDPRTVEADFRPGQPDLELFPRAAWARAYNWPRDASGPTASRSTPTG